MNKINADEMAKECIEIFDGTPIYLTFENELGGIFRASIRHYFDDKLLNISGAGSSITQALVELNGQIKKHLAQDEAFRKALSATNKNHGGALKKLADS